MPRLVEQFEHGLDAPICLTWELTYACNLACVHCLSSSGKRDPRELTTQQCKDIIDELERMQVFYVNIGGGEPTVRPDFWELVDYATAHHVGVKFSTNGVRITPEVAARLAASDYVDVQISLDGATAEVNDAVRGPGSFAMAIRALENLADAGFTDAKISVVVTRHNVDQLDEFKALADALRRHAADHPAAPVGPRRRRVGRAAPDRRAAGAALRLAGRPRRPGAHRRLVLPPVGPRRAGRAGRPEPVRRRPGGVPDRPGRRRLRLPVRHPRPVPRRKHSVATAVSTTSGRTRRCSASCASRSRRARAAAAATTTAAAAAAWPPSSSPACRWTAPTPNACRATASRRWRSERDKPKPSGRPLPHRSQARARSR